MEPIPESAITYACPDCYAEGCAPALIQHSPRCPRSNNHDSKRERKQTALSQKQRALHLWRYTFKHV